MCSGFNSEHINTEVELLQLRLLIKSIVLWHKTIGPPIKSMQVKY